MSDLERARAFFANDRFATEAAKIRIDEVSPGRAVCSLGIGGVHKNAVGQVMGGVIFTLADFVFAVATNFDAPFPTVTVNSSVSYFSPVKGSRLTGTSRLIKDGKRTCFYQIDVTDDTGLLIASVTTTGAHLIP